MKLPNVTIELIKSYSPCLEGIDNFEKLYPEYNDSLENLLMLDNISYSDKVWLACKMLDKPTLVQWSVECAEFVVDNFNSQFPNDNRVNECIDTVKRYLFGEEVDLESAAWSASRSAVLATWSAALSASRSARAAAWSASRSAALSASRSARAAAWSAWSASRSATWSAAESEAWLVELDQEDINLSILIALVSNL